jgi:hypothetical protein
MRRSSEGAAGVPQHTHTLDVHVEAGPKTEASPRQQQVGEHTAPLPRPPPPPPPAPFAACMRGMHTRVLDVKARPVYEPGGYKSLERSPTELRAAVWIRLIKTRARSDEPTATSFNTL